MLVISKRLIPRSKEIVPILFLAYFPMDKPIYVNIQLTTENIMGHNKILSVIIFIPIPVVKLSILTDNENTNIPTILIFTSSISFSNKSFIMKTAIINRQMLTISLGEIGNILINLIPMVYPIKGIIKCIIPTDKDNATIIFFLRFNVPRPKANENASILNANPIIIIGNISFK